MKTKIAAFLSSVLFASVAMAATPSKTELSRFGWQDVTFSQKIVNELSEKQIRTFSQTLAGTNSAIIGYKIPANQGTLKIKVSSLVVDNDHIFVPNILVLDANFNESLTYPASQFKVVEERGFEGGQIQAELSLTPATGQDFIYLLIYTTEKDLAGQTTFTHPVKLYEKAKGNQPPAIADLLVKHTNSGQIQINVDGIQSTQFVGLGNVANGGALFEAKPTVAQTVGAEIQAVKNPQKNAKPKAVEKTTEQYFNEAVTQALKNNDISKAMNLVNEAEQLGLSSPRQIFLKQVSAKK
ncbi:maltose operon protein MalM [Actinobacillus equuli subsp. equuli]|uniref:Maltose operon protein MalM n=1 Tax=Actinobacillus equuli subsp. equuli TaxID=202947 RepID=A0A9X4G1J9_ACTEU|nr:maltose operon protein MalM [Actinobacillus equuli]MDE8034164.1 maltose operon protein MalM [Actinobacillus equuli subsp. equuli]MDG4947855.1 maltose operon protein MalM [Actinobacillus equuli subsp. haemolyticus]